LSRSLKYNLKKDDIVYFLHIPKTSGVSLTITLDDHFHLDSICPARTWNYLQRNPIDDLSKYGLIRAHFGYSINRYLNKKPIYITMLRSPIDWVISQYVHMIEHYEDEYGLKAFLDGKKPTLSDLVNDPDKNSIFINTQIRFIALDLDVYALTKSFNKKDKEKFYFLDFPPFKSPNIPIEKLLKIAKQRLSEFVFFGLKEKHEESLMLLCYTFGWKPIHNIPQVNISNQKITSDSLPKDIIKKITEFTKNDSELYKFAEDLFQSRFNSMINELKERYFEPKFANLTFKEMIFALLEKHFENGPSPEPVSSIDFDFKQPLSGTGWHAREFLPDGTAFRWTGPITNSYIDFPLDFNCDLKIQFCVLNTIDPLILNNLRLEVNGIPVEIILKQNQDGKKIYQGVAKAEKTQNKLNFLRLEFQVIKTISPNSIDQKSNDHRKIGIALEWIKINKKI